MNETYSKAFMILLIFWTLLSILTSYTNIDFWYDSITELKSDSISDIQDQNSLADNLLNSVFNVLDKFPILNRITPLFKILTFRYSELIPPWLVYILDLIGIFTIIFFINMWKP